MLTQATTAAAPVPGNPGPRVYLHRPVRRVDRKESERTGKNMDRKENHGGSAPPLSILQPRGDPRGDLWPREAELLGDDLVWGGGPVTAQTDDQPFAADDPVPAVGQARFHDDERRAVLGNDRGLVLIALAQEQLHRGHGDDTRGSPVLLEDRTGLRGERDLGARGDDDELRLSPAGLQQHVGSPGDKVGGWRGGARDDRDRLPREDERRGAVAAPGGEGPRQRGLDAVAGADHDEVHDRPQGSQMLDRLVGRAILAQG